MTPALQRIGGALMAVAVAFAGTSAAQADGRAELCAALSGQGGSGYRVLDSRELTHVNARPWHIVTDGVAFLVQAPRGTTEADLHRDVSSCSANQGDRVQVRRTGEHYVVKLTSTERGRALELARSAR
jgi:hypothetical protein